MTVPDHPARVRVQDTAGHRARLRKRLIEGGGDALLDHELLEFLLTLAIPRRDTKPIAKALLREFGGLAAVFTADAEALSRVDGVGEGAVSAIKIAQATALRLLRDQASERPVLASWQALMDYLHADMAHHVIERVRVLHLNSRNMLIRDELVSTGTIDQSAVHVREVIRRAIDLSSSAIILVHNHPSYPASITHTHAWYRCSTGVFWSCVPGAAPAYWGRLLGDRERYSTRILTPAQPVFSTARECERWAA